jgi:dienelactone hydrolase
MRALSVSGAVHAIVRGFAQGVPVFTVWLTIAAVTGGLAGQTTDRLSPETVRYTNDGLRLEAYLYRPSGSGPFPLVVHNHSGTDPAPRWGAVIARLLTDAGYAVLVPQRRGTGNSEGQRFTATGDDRGRSLVADTAADTGDVLAVLEQVVRDSRSRIDAQRLAIMGYSAGGSVAVLGAARSDRFRAVITQAPSSVNWRLEAPLRDAVLAAARRVRVPTLCMVAENDNTTDSARSLCDAVKAGGAAASLIVYPPFTPKEPSANPLVAPGHMLFNREEGVSIWGKDVLAFLAKYLPTQP